MKPKLVAIRPSELVILAIHNLGEKSGSSEKDIIRFISKKYGLDEDHLTPRVEAALKRGLNFGILSCKNGRYGLEDVPEPPANTKEGNLNEMGNNRKTNDRECTGLRGRKRERSEIAERISDIIEREIHQFKKAKGFGGETANGAGKPAGKQDNTCPEPTGTTRPKQESSRSRRHQVEKQPPRARRAPRVQRAQPKARRKMPATRARKSRGGCRERTKKVVGRGTKKYMRTRAAKPRPKYRQPKKNVTTNAASNEGTNGPANGGGSGGGASGGGSGGGGALKSLAKVFGMKCAPKPAAKPRKSKAPSAAAKRKGTEKSCPKVCPKSCPNSIRRRQCQSNGKMATKTNQCTDNKPKGQNKTVLHPCQNMGY